eukprot:NODE_23_length_42016_cov_0.755803.p5 type:complete len:717 gc:universal NODE_23_length_42016_cov_0.755803:24438-22288(-)
MQKNESKALSNVDLVEELGNLLLKKCIESGAATIPKGYESFDYKINYKELVSFCKSSEKFAIPVEWFTMPVQKPSLLLAKSQLLQSPLSESDSKEFTEVEETNFTHLNVLEVLIDYDKIEYYKFFKKGTNLTTKDLQLGTFELLLGLLLFNKPNFNIKYVISDKIRLFYGINKKKSIELAEYYSIVPLNQNMDSTTINLDINSTQNIEEFSSVLMTYCVLNKDPFLLKFVLARHFRSNKEWSDRQFKLLAFVLLEKSTIIIKKMDDKIISLQFDEIINEAFTILDLFLGENSYYDSVLDTLMRWMQLIFKFNFSQQDTNHGFLTSIMFAEIRKVQLALFKNDGWSCEDSEYKPFIKWFCDLFCLHPRQILWGNFLALYSAEIIDFELIKPQFKFLLEDKSASNVKLSPLVAQYYLNILFKQIVTEYHLASDICVDIVTLYLDTCELLLTVEFSHEIMISYENSAISGLKEQWVKASISRLMELIMKQASERNIAKLTQILIPSNSDFDENTILLFLEAIESTFIKDWSVRFEALSKFVRPELFWRRHVHNLCSTIFEKTPKVTIKAFGSIFQQCCDKVNEIHIFMGRALQEYAIDVRNVDLSWFLLSCLENWIFEETSKLIGIGQQCYEKDQLDLFSDLRTDGVYNFLLFVNRIVDMFCKLDVKSLTRKTACYLILSLGPSFYHLARLYLKNPLRKVTGSKLRIEEPISNVYIILT